MDKPIDISKLCLDKLSKIKDTDKYEKLKDCKSINPKKIQEKTNSKIISWVKIIIFTMSCSYFCCFIKIYTRKRPIKKGSFRKVSISILK